MSDGTLDRNDLVEGENKVPYEIPEFSVVALSVITLGGTPGSGDSGNGDPQEPFGSSAGSVDEENDYDKDPLDDDPWGSRGGGG